MLWVYQKIRMVRTALCTKDSPRQMAAGLACGLLLGLVPKGNLLALILATTLLTTRMSLATGMLCAFLVSLIAPFCDPLTHRLGQWMLTNVSFTPLWRSFARLPLVSWTSFNNTVVMGSLTLGTILMYPVYRLSLPWMEHLQRKYTSAPPTHTGEESAFAPELPTAATVDACRPEAAPLQPSVADQLPHILPRRTNPDRRRSCA